PHPRGARPPHRDHREPRLLTALRRERLTGGPARSPGGATPGGRGRCRECPEVARRYIERGRCVQCPRASPIAFAEYRTAGAALCLSPRGDLHTGCTSLGTPAFP